MEKPKIAQVELSESDPEWESRFVEAKKEILDACGDKIVSVEHMGSTSISGIMAKPEIDILVGVNNLEDIEGIIEPLREIGYPYYKNFEEFVPQRRYFRKSEGITPLVHMHIYEIDGDDYKKHVFFRDHLRTNPEIARDYENLKVRLLKQSSGDRGVYQDGKKEFIQKVLSLVNL